MYRTWMNVDGKLLKLGPEQYGRIRDVYLERSMKAFNGDKSVIHRPISHFIPCARMDITIGNPKVRHVRSEEKNIVLEFEYDDWEKTPDSERTPEEIRVGNNALRKNGRRKKEEFVIRPGQAIYCQGAMYYLE